MTHLSLKAAEPNEGMASPLLAEFEIGNAKQWIKVSGVRYGVVHAIESCSSPSAPMFRPIVPAPQYTEDVLGTKKEHLCVDLTFYVCRIFLPSCLKV